MKLICKIAFEHPRDILEGDSVNVRFDLLLPGGTSNTLCYYCNKPIPVDGTKVIKINGAYFAVCGKKRCNTLIALGDTN